MALEYITGSFPGLINSQNLAGQIISAFNLQNVQIIQTPANPYPNQKGNTIDAPLYKSAIGTPVFSNIVFQPVSYTDNKGIVKSSVKLQFDTVILTLNQTKSIVTTAIQGADGTVKEYIGMGDYQIDINLVITGTNGSYPADAVRNLRQMLEAPKPIEVVSWYLQLWGISYIVVEDFSIRQEIGGYSYQLVTIKAISDFPQVFNVS